LQAAKFDDFRRGLGWAIRKHFPAGVRGLTRAKTIHHEPICSKRHSWQGYLHPFWLTRDSKVSLFEERANLRHQKATQGFVSKKAIVVERAFPSTQNISACRSESCIRSAQLSEVDSKAGIEGGSRDIEDKAPKFFCVPARTNERTEQRFRNVRSLHFHSQHPTILNEHQGCLPFSLPIGPSLIQSNKVNQLLLTIYFALLLHHYYYCCRRRPPSPSAPSSQTGRR
jgi:hypothetical protein